MEMDLVAITWLFVFFAQSSISPQNGESEIARLMSDRPLIAALIKRHKSLRPWLRKAFDGQFSKSKIRWQNDDSNLPSNILGQHSYTPDGYAIITVSHKPCAIDQLTILIDECVNVRYESTFQGLYKSVSAGRIQREDFVTKMMQAEHEAFLVAQRVLRRHLPLTRKEAAGADTYRKLMGVPHDFTAAMKYYEKTKRDEFDIKEYYRSVYDDLFSKTPLPPLRFE
jgi:hypothetical protein